jgi:hypothetical protein
MKRVLFGLGTVLGIAALIVLAVLFHSRAVKSYGDMRERKGATDAYGRVEVKALKLALEANNLAIAARERNRAENTRITGSAGSLLLRGPGKAACTDTSAQIGAASGHDAQSRPADASMVGVYSTERPVLACLPFAATVAFAREHDLNRAEVLERRNTETAQEPK